MSDFLAEGHGSRGYVDAIPATSPHPVLLLDAGDIYQGTLVSNHSWGRALIDITNAMGFDASVLGNHEFDFGDPVLESAGVENRFITDTLLRDALIGMLKERFGVPAARANVSAGARR